MSTVAIFLPSLTGGGAERAMLNLPRGFRDLGHAVELVVASATGPYRDELPAGVRLVDLGSPRVIRALPGPAPALRRRRPDRALRRDGARQPRGAVGAQPGARPDPHHRER